jgi:hypothetical protein
MRRVLAFLTLALAFTVGIPAAASAHAAAAAPVELPTAAAVELPAAAPAELVPLAITAQACNPCYAAARPKSGLDAVRFRTGPGTGYTALGSVQAGQSILCWYPRALNPICNWTSTGYVTGGSYSCGSYSGNTWLKVAWTSGLVYVARECVTGIIRSSITPYVQ